MKPGRRWQRAPLPQSGLAVLEFAMMLPVLLVLLFASIDLGRVILIRQIMLNLSREAANLACRGTAFADVMSAVQTSAAPLNLAQDGYVILTEIYRSSASVVTVKSRLTYGGRAGSSHVGATVGGAAVLPASTPAMPPTGMSLYVAEVFYHVDPITPLGQFVTLSGNSSYYDVAFF